MFNGDRLRELREENNFTQEEMAQKLGITQGSYAHFERMRRQPSKNLVLEMCKIFDVQEASLYTNQEVDKVRQLIDDLKSQGILRTAEDVTGDAAELILDAVKSELRMSKLKKEQRD